MQKFSRIITLLLLLFSIEVQATGCISLAVAGNDHWGFWVDLIKGAKKATTELKMELHYRGINRDTDENSQKLAINYLSQTYNCSGMIIAPTGKSINKIVEVFHNEGIPVVYIDRDTGGKRMSVVKSNNYNAGVIAAKKLANALIGKGNDVALLRLKKGVSSTDEREKGFEKEARRLGLNIVIDEYIGVTTGEARTRALTVLSSPDIDGIFTSNGTTTTAVIQALERVGSTIHPVHIGFDGSEYLDQKVKLGQLYGYIKQDPYNMGYISVYSIYNAIKEGIYESIVDIPVVFIIKKDLE